MKPFHSAFLPVLATLATAVIASGAPNETNVIAGDTAKNGRIAAIARPDKSLYQWWDMNGEPVIMNKSWLEGGKITNYTLAILVETHDKGFLSADIGIPDQDNSLSVGLSRSSTYGSKAGIYRTIFYYKSNPEQKLRDYMDRGGQVNVRLSHDSGPWVEVGTIGEGQTIQTNGLSLSIEKVKSPSSLRYIDVIYDFGPDSAISLAAVDDKGKRLDPFSRYIFSSGKTNKIIYLNTNKFGPFQILNRPVDTKLVENIPTRQKPAEVK